MCVHFLPCSTDSGAVRQIKKIVLGIYIVRHEAADEMDLPENAGISLGFDSYYCLHTHTHTLDLWFKLEILREPKNL